MVTSQDRLLYIMHTYIHIYIYIYIYIILVSKKNVHMLLCRCESRFEGKRTSKSHIQSTRSNKVTKAIKMLLDEI